MSSVDTDSAARSYAVDPRHHVVLEASAGTGKTTVLVQRYVNLLRAGVEPGNILAITFTRKAATEMRERIIRELRTAASLSNADRARWVTLRDRLSEIAISTIDAFCLSLLREFPLEADLDPGFDLADETEVPRFVEEALDRSMRIFAARAKDDPEIALVIAQLGVSRTRAGLAALLDRRLVAWHVLDRFLERRPADLDARTVCVTAAQELLETLVRVPGGLRQFLADGPSGHPRYQLFIREVERLPRIEDMDEASIRALIDRLSLHFLTQDGSARKGSSIHPYNASHFPSDAASKRHRSAVVEVAPAVEAIAARFGRDLNVILARGIRRMFAIALEQYRRTLDTRSALDFSEVLDRALDLLRRMDEFSQSRFRLESRYHHVLVDEFQDTSRAQWELVSLLLQSWGEGMGLASNPSIFIVGDRKQSIYRFRDAEVAVLHEAGRYIEALRPGAGARRSISRSFRAVPELLEFVNDVCDGMAVPTSRPDAFTYAESDRFPPVPDTAGLRGPVLGISVAASPESCAAAVAHEIQRILKEDVVRDRKTGVARGARAGDIAILFRSRTSHREFERELERRGIPTYVYKGLGFFDSDEIKDVCALLRYLAHPTSDLRAAAFLRSGFARISDAGLAQLAPDVARALLEDAPGVVLDDEDAAVLSHLRTHVPRWLQLVDRIPPADLLEQMLPDTAYAFEIRGRRQQQAWENLKKMRGLVRRIQNRGYATLARIADHVDALSAGDESNAVLEAMDAVNLMTVHASKGLEFPVVFVVNMARGAAGLPRPVRVIASTNGEAPSVSVGPFVSEVDAQERERELHESRRLLYVAMTRARDRLYLSSALKDGALAPGRGSLAEVLPASLRPVFARASDTAGDMVEWRAPSGRAYVWRVCRVPEAEANILEPPLAPDVPSLVGPIGSRASVRRLSVSEWLSRTRPLASTPCGVATADDALVGVLVHRLFQRASLRVHEPAQDDRAEDVTEMAAAALHPEESATALDRNMVVQRAAAIWSRLQQRDDIVRLLRSGTVLTEVPFSLALEDAGERYMLRGIIDCVIVHDGGEITVVELKTGSPQDVHQEQLRLYVGAVRDLCAGRVVHGRLIYQS